MDRALLYLRQSKAREESISLEMQEAAGRALCAANGYEVVAVLSDPGISGGTFNRPGVKAAMEMMARGDANVLVIWRWSRLSRKRLDWYVALDKIEQLGGRIESATEQIDTTTSVGRLSRGVLVELAAFEHERFSDQWKDIKQRRIDMGLPSDGQPRFGYRLMDGLYVPDETWGPVLTDLYRMYAKGVSARQLTVVLNEAGAATRHGKRWTSQAVTVMLDTGFAAGLIKTDGRFVPGQHPPLITPAQWRAHQRAREAKPTSPGRGTRHALSGLLRCAYCHRALHAQKRAGYPDGTLWACSTKAKGGVCNGTVGWAPVVDRLLNAWLTTLLEGKDGEFREAVRAAKKPAKDSAVLRRRLIKVETDLLSIARKNNDGFYDDQTYLRLRAELLDDQRMLVKALDETPAPDPVVMRGVVEEILASVGEERNVALRKVLRHVTVFTNERPKYTIVPLWVETQ